jgi:long-subunit acyl-CoA synthetase (AMP-forming)
MDLNDIVCLFRQVQCLQPTAMACPPNIWNGLYLLYRLYLEETSSDPHDAGNGGQGNGQNTLEGGRQKQALLRISSLFGPRIKFLVTGGGPTASEVSFM